jgi:hypothetical protein
MKNIGKIIIAALLAMSLIIWTSPSEAGNGHYRSGHRSYYKNGPSNQRFDRYQHNYPSRRYNNHYGYDYKPRDFRNSHYSNFGLYLSPNRTRIQIRFAF